MLSVKLPNYMSYISDSGAPMALRYLLVCSKGDRNLSLCHS